MTNRVRLRSVALPVEHGGWALVGAPLALGFWVAPSVAGGWLTLFALVLFLVRQPLQLLVADWRRGRTYPRTPWAWTFALAYGATAVVTFVLAWHATPHRFWWPLALAAPLAAVQVGHDLLTPRRATSVQACGVVATNALVAAIAMARGWSFARAATLWLLLALQAATAIVYVGTRLRLARGEPAPCWPAHAVHLGALAIVFPLALRDAVPWLAVAVFAVLGARAWVGLRPRARTAPAVRVGIEEVAFTALTVVGLALGVRGGW